MKLKRRFAPVFAAFACLSLLAACNSHATTTPVTSAPANSTDETVHLTVFAAASLHLAFTDIAQQVLAKTDPQIEVSFSFEGSSTLVDQLKQGAPADVFASADMKNMSKASSADLVETPQPFASNVLTLIVPPGNPAHVTGLNQTLEGAKLVVCASGVPCGNATAELAKKLSVTLHPVSEEQKVTDVRGKVESGEADAGIVYTTDAKAAGDKVDVVTIEGAEKVVNAYPIAVVKNTKQASAAKAFIEAVLSPEGRAILAKYGFGKPLSQDR